VYGLLLAPSAAEISAMQASCWLQAS